MRNVLWSVMISARFRRRPKAKADAGVATSAYAPSFSVWVVFYGPEK